MKKPTTKVYRVLKGKRLAKWVQSHDAKLRRIFRGCRRKDIGERR